MSQSSNVLLQWVYREPPGQLAGTDRNSFCTGVSDIYCINRDLWYFCIMLPASHIQAQALTFLLRAGPSKILCRPGISTLRLGEDQVWRYACQVNVWKASLFLMIRLICAYCPARSCIASASFVYEAKRNHESCQLYGQATGTPVVPLSTHKRSRQLPIPE